MTDVTENTPERVEFLHKFFQSAEEGYFRMSQQGDTAVFAFKITGEDQEIVLSLQGIKREFDLTDSPDGKMLDTIEEGLKFIKVMQIGDKLPKELRTREASWEIKPHHVDLARSRLTVQLITWISGEEKIINNSGSLQKILDDTETQSKINQALDEAAERLGKGNQGRERVLELLEDLADELAHIEALREEFENTNLMRQKLKGLSQCYINELSILNNIDPVTRLLSIAIKEYSRVFNELDANTGEIVSVMRNIERNTNYIRRIRDNLYCRLIAWDDIFHRWRTMDVRRSRENENLLRDTYTFLAPRFMPEDEWVLLSKLQGDNASKLDTEMIWSLGA